MKKNTYGIRYTEEWSGIFYVEATSESDALDEFEYLVSEGKVDFDRLGMSDSCTTAFLIREGGKRDED